MFAVNVFLIVILLCFFEKLYEHFFCSKTKKSEDIFSRESTSSLKGFAMMIIMLAHVSQYESSFEELVLGGRLIKRIVMSCGAVGVSIFFFLSGFGCLLSISKAENTISWLTKRAVKLILSYIFSFLFVSLMLVLLSHSSLSEIVWNFVRFQIPNSSSWYLKVQLLFYVLLAFARKAGKNKMPFLAFLFSFLYALSAYCFRLPDYWWKTSLCFGLGCLIAQYKKYLFLVYEKKSFSFILLLLGLISYAYVMKSPEYLLLPQLLSYCLISLTLSVFWDMIIGSDHFLLLTSNYSLELYLVHIGLVEVFLGFNLETNVKIVGFLFISILGAYCANYFSKRLSSYIQFI